MTDNTALVSWSKLKCRWLSILLSSCASPSPVCNFSLFIFLSFFSISFLPIPLFYLSLQSPFYILSRTPVCVPLSLSAPPHLPPCSCLSLLSKLQVAMNSLPGNELSTPQEQWQSSARRRGEISSLRSYYTSCLCL